MLDEQGRSALQKGCTNLYNYQSWLRVPFAGNGWMKEDHQPKNGASEHSLLAKFFINKCNFISRVGRIKSLDEGWQQVQEGRWQSKDLLSPKWESGDLPQSHDLRICFSIPPLSLWLSPWNPWPISPRNPAPGKGPGHWERTRCLKEHERKMPHVPTLRFHFQSFSKMATVQEIN